MAKFRPTLIPTLFTIPALILLISLGTWQLYRLEWKNTLIANVGKALHQEEIDLPSDVASPAALQYRKIRVKGQYLHDKEIYLYTGTREYRGEQGYDILTPLKTKEGNVVLIDRGWVPIQKKLPESRPETLTIEEVSVDGYVLLGEKKKFFTPANELSKNLWFFIDIPAIANYTHLHLPDFYILASANTNPKQLPVGRDLSIKIRNDHLQYAITWYSAALALLVIFVLYHRKRG